MSAIPSTVRQLCQGWNIFFREHYSMIILSLDVNIILIVKLFTNGVITAEEREHLLQQPSSIMRAHILLNYLTDRPLKLKTVISVLDSSDILQNNAATILKELDALVVSANLLSRPPQIQLTEPLQISPLLLPPIIISDEVQQKRPRYSMIDTPKIEDFSEALLPMPETDHLGKTSGPPVIKSYSTFNQVTNLTHEKKKLQLPTQLQHNAADTTKKYFIKFGEGITNRASRSHQAILPLTEIKKPRDHVWICLGSYERLEETTDPGCIRTNFNVDFNFKKNSYEGNLVEYFRNEKFGQTRSVSFIGNFSFEDIYSVLNIFEGKLKELHLIDVRVKFGLFRKFKVKRLNMNLQSWRFTLFGDDFGFNPCKIDMIISPLLMLWKNKDTVLDTFLEFQGSGPVFGIIINGKNVFSYKPDGSLVLFGATMSQKSVLELVKEDKNSVTRISIFCPRKYLYLKDGWSNPKLTYINLNSCRVVGDSWSNILLKGFPNLTTLIIDNCFSKLDLRILSANNTPKLTELIVCNDTVILPMKKHKFLKLCWNNDQSISLINCKFGNRNYLSCPIFPSFVEVNYVDKTIKFREFFWNYDPYRESKQQFTSERDKDKLDYFKLIQAHDFSWDFESYSTDCQFDAAIINFDRMRYGNDYNKDFILSDKKTDQTLSLTQVDKKLSYLSNTKLGAGKYGTVFKGYVTLEYSRVEAAVKVVEKQLVSEKMVKRENSLIELNHRNIVQYYYSVADDFFHYIAMELCDEPLYVWVEKSATEEMVPVEITKRLHLLRQMTKGIAYLHEYCKGRIHRDLRPPNILIKKENNKYIAKIADFGFCKELPTGCDATSNSEGARKGEYVAPELTYSHMCDSKADIFSLGQIFYYVLSNGSSPRGKQMLSWDYWGVLEVIKTMTEQNPSKRMSAVQLKDYPIFWYLKPEKFVAFLGEFGVDGSHRNADLTNVIMKKNWKNVMEKTYFACDFAKDFVKTLRGYFNYDVTTSEFLRAVRNSQTHAISHLDTAPSFVSQYCRLDLEEPIFDPQEFFRVWFQPFPDLFYQVWNVLNTPM